MRKLVYVAVAVALAVAAALTITDAPAQADALEGDTVGICHYPGHNGDFVLGNQDPNAPNTGCRGPDGVTTGPLAGPNATGDGIVMHVGLKACEKGHRAGGNPPTNLECDAFLP